MGNKNVSFSCRKSFSLGTDFNVVTNNKCPNCADLMVQMPHRFRAPKKTDDQGWQVVDFLVKEGFPFHKIYDEISQEPVMYPNTLRAAREFVVKYKTQRRIH